MRWPKHAAWWTAAVVSLVGSGLSVVLEKTVFSDVTLLIAAVISFCLIWNAKVTETDRLKTIRAERQRRRFLGLSAVSWLPLMLLTHYHLGAWPFGQSASPAAPTIFFGCKLIRLPAVMSPERE